MIQNIRKQLPDLFNSVPINPLEPVTVPQVDIAGLAIDSRQLRSGDLFFALVGGNVDGHAYIPAAIANGATAVIGSRPPHELESSIAYIQVADTRQALAHLAAAFYDFPARDLTVIGVTGTDGKTTTCNLIHKILQTAGYKAGIISTVNAVIGDELIDTGFHVTTPEAHEIQHYLYMMKAAGLTHVVLEATSHGLAQERVTACEFDIGVVTNITHEHLDYHGSYENYRAAKARLFQHLMLTADKPTGNPRLAILNKDDASYEFLDQFIPGRKITYSLTSGDVYARDIAYDSAGLHFTACIQDGKQISIESSLVGSFNISNILAAISATVAGLGVNSEAAQEGIKVLPGIPGRMERIDLGQEFSAIVDFAHTPNALRRAVETARQMTDGRVIAVFGSAGLRDREKRRLMAEESVQLADVTILTAEDPRTESLDAILDEMVDAAQEYGGKEGSTLFRVADRGEAICQAVRMAAPGDVVIAMGKGHEQSMCFGTTEYPWDDRTAMRAALAERLGLTGIDMPYLPTRG